MLICASACTKEGKQGPPGNANVRSINFDVQLNDWKYQAGSAYLEKPLADITADIYNKGSINVYWHVNNNWVALPVTYPKDSISQSMGYEYNTGKLRIFITNSNGSTPVSLGTATYRVVIISGT
jgi:hypothetical protein